MKTENQETAVGSASSNAESSSPNVELRLRLPLHLFNNHLDKFPKIVAQKARKAGVEKRSDKRTWGPEITVSPTEIKKVFDVAEAMYKDKETDKPTKTYAYQLRNAAAKLGGFEIKNVRQYNRKPKPVAANTDGPIMHMAASMPPRENLARAATTLDVVRGILRDNGQNSVATMLDSVASDIALPEQASQQG